MHAIFISIVHSRGGGGSCQTRDYVCIIRYPPYEARDRTESVPLCPEKNMAIKTGILYIGVNESLMSKLGVFYVCIPLSFQPETMNKRRLGSSFRLRPH